MRFISKWSYGSANYLMAKLNHDHEKRRVYNYGFQVVYGAIFKAIIVISISALLGTLVPTLISIMVFGSVRMVAGGYHMDTYGRCVITSLAMFMGSGAIAQYLYVYWDQLSLVVLTGIIFIIAVLCVLAYAPKDNPNRKIDTPEEIRKFKRLSIIFVFAWFAISGLFIWFQIWNYRSYVLAAALGILLEAFAITPAGHKFFDVIKGNLKKFGVEKVKSRVL